MAKHHGFRVDLTDWKVDLRTVDGWASKFFKDHARRDRVLFGWLTEPHTVNGLRSLVTTNLKYWAATKEVRYLRAWVRPMSAHEFVRSIGRDSRVAHQAAERCVADILSGILLRVTHVATRRRALRKRTRDRTRPLLDAIFGSLRSNAQKRLAAVTSAKLALLRELVAVLSRYYEAKPDLAAYLPDDWETITPEALEQRTARSRRPWRGRGLFIERRRQAQLLSELEERQG
jgi:hypothetical protein